VSYDEVLEDKYIKVTVLYVVVGFLCGCITVMLFLMLCCVFFVSLSILIVMYVTFWDTVLLCVNVYWRTITRISGHFRLP
jgi:hypothetical protein